MAHNLEDQIFGKLIVVDKLPPNKSGNRGAKWFCLCECGNWCEAAGGDLVSGRKWHCGCVLPKNQYDLTGEKIGKLTVIRREGSVMSGSKKRSTWLCQCECGNFKVIRGSNLRNKKSKTKSCGCLLSPGKRAEYARKGHRTARSKEALSRLFVKEDKYYGWLPDK